MSDRLEDVIAALRKISRAQLQAQWRYKLKQDPPLHIEKPLLVPLLAYKLQEQAYGGLKPATKRRLRDLAGSFEKNPKKAGAMLSKSQELSLAQG